LGQPLTQYLREKALLALLSVQVLRTVEITRTKSTTCIGACTRCALPHATIGCSV
jgi:hypothetical protein